ncbi:MAG: ATP-dependent helicase RecG [Actinomycetia bacterium]|nr:ATP-dependent helicase RecG [Actinomycetes bacterium]
MALRKIVDRLRQPIEELDRRDLEAYCTTLGATPLDKVELRRPVRVAGEVRSLRIVPRAGADAVEVSINDGRGQVTAVFLGRRRILGVSPGRRIVVEGVITGEGRRRLIYNPVYKLLGS